MSNQHVGEVQRKTGACLSEHPVLDLKVHLMAQGQRGAAALHLSLSLGSRCFNPQWFPSVTSAAVILEPPTPSPQGLPSPFSCVRSLPVVSHTFLLVYSLASFVNPSSCFDGTSSSSSPLFLPIPVPPKPRSWASSLFVGFSC